MSVDAPVRLIRVTKRYGDTVAVDRLTFSLRGGEVACLVGPNGSGKSTVLGMVAGLARPTAGEVRVGGVGTRSNRVLAPSSRVTYLPQRTTLYEHLTGLEHLRFVFQLHGSGKEDPERLERLLRSFDLERHQHRTIRGYSEGMKRKLALLAALAPEPAVVLLDEPLAGVDTAGSSEAVGLLREARRQGACILIATHHYAAFSPLADRWLTLRGGRLVSDSRRTPGDTVRGRTPSPSTQVPGRAIAVADRRSR